MKVLVTGGSGFIGSHLVEQLIADGCDVVNLSLHKASQNPVNKHPKVTLVQGSFGDLDLMQELLSDVEVVFHVAWSSIPSLQLDRLYDEVNTDIGGTINLLNACTKSGVKKFVFLSSGGTVYGIPRQIPITEQHVLQPISSYGIGKTAAEHYIRLFHKTQDLDYQIFRVSNAYGERQNIKKGQGIIGIWLSLILRGKPIEIWGDGEVIRDFVYVKDLAREVSKARHSSSAHRKIFNLAYGKGYSLNKVIRIMREVTNHDFKVLYKPGRSIDVPVNVLSTDNIKKTTGYAPQTSLNEGIAKVWKWIRQDI